MAAPAPEDWDGVDQTHLTGDIYFINRYRDGWWMAAVLALLFTPPIGAVMLVYMGLKSVTRQQDDVTVYPQP